MRSKDWMFLYAPDEAGGDAGDGADAGADVGADAGGSDAGDTITMTKAEADALRRETAEARKAARKAKQDAERAAEEKAKADGDFKAAAEAAEKRALEAEQRATRLEQDTRVQRIAGRLGFRDPQDAARFLDDDELESDQATERALKQLKRDKPYLAQTSGRSGGEVNGGGGAARSMDDLIRQTAGRA